MKLAVWTLVTAQWTMKVKLCLNYNGCHVRSSTYEASQHFKHERLVLSKITHKSNILMLWTCSMSDTLFVKYLRISCRLYLTIAILSIEYTNDLVSQQREQPELGGQANSIRRHNKMRATGDDQIFNDISVSGWDADEWKYNYKSLALHHAMTLLHTSRSCYFAHTHTNTRVGFSWSSKQPCRCGHARDLTICWICNKNKNPTRSASNEHVKLCHQFLVLYSLSGVGIM